LLSYTPNNNILQVGIYYKYEYPTSRIILSLSVKVYHMQLEILEIGIKIYSREIYLEVKNNESVALDKTLRKAC